MLIVHIVVQHLYIVQQIGIQPKMIIYGEIEQIQMNQENDHV